jgi:hypothetical protein
MNGPIAYTYEADTHCPACTAERFGPSRDGRDSEGNRVGAIWPWDEWCEPSEPGRQYLACGTCYGVIEEHKHDSAAMAIDLYGVPSWRAEEPSND